MLRRQTGKPATHGLYVAYVDNGFDGLMYAERIFLSWDGAWSYPSSDQKYRGEVYGWIGPLEPMKFDYPATAR